MKIIKQILTVLSFFTLISSLQVDARAMAKCKDDAGKWHYGDHVGHLCKTNEIIKLDKHGVVKGQIERQKTQEEFDKERIEKENVERDEAKAKAITQAERKEKKRILGSYEDTDDIEKARSQKLGAYKQRKEMFDAYINYLNVKKSVLEKNRKKLDEKTNQGRVAKINGDLAKLAKEIKSSTKSKDDINKGILEVNKQFDRELVLFVEFSQEN